MLEVRNLKRVYKVKGGNSVYALNDVSLKFPEAGLIFILGKSGSGKSTLLNVMGGLDNVDDGEIIINGKSSKTFSKIEMDSYRNTYLGFIFQEYNILSDFTVRENIALALQLQHKKATDEVINKILEEVDLVGYGKRKPNELSGGQKQRVAIARALVKEPKIIFGDEPTGALDSNTGKQVFETLKRLSDTRLVVIVSHDRDFAEHFGDRVIELKDGKVISDITKTAVTSKKTDDGLAFIGDNIIRLDKDRPLKAEDLPLINKAIANSEKEVYIVADSHVNNALCEAAKIDKDGNREEFVETDPDQIKVGADEFKPIKSRFSLGRAFRMGAKSLRVKPFRLVMTILLSTVAFSLFGASLTLSFFNTKSAMTSAISKNNLTSLSFSLNESGGSGLTDQRIKEIETETGAKIYYADPIDASLTVPSSQDLFHLKRYKGKMPIDEKGLTDFGFGLVSGAFPSSADECAISLYAYYSYKDLGIGYDSKSDDYITPEKVDYSTLLGKNISFSDYSGSGSFSYKITGIIDTKLPENLLAYRGKTEEINASSDDARALYMLSMGQQVSVHNSLFVNGNSSGGDSDASLSTSLTVGSNDKESSFGLSVGYYPSHQEASMFFDASKSELQQGQVLCSLHASYSLFAPNPSAEEGTFSRALSNIQSQETVEQQSYVDAHYKEFYENHKNDEEFAELKDASSNDETLKEAVLKCLFSTKSGFYTDEYKAFSKTWISKEKEILKSVTDYSSLQISGTLPTKAKTEDGGSVSETWTFSVSGIDLTPSLYNGDFISLSKTDFSQINEKLIANGYSSSSNYSRVGYALWQGNSSTLSKFLDSYLKRKNVAKDAGYDWAEMPSGYWYLSITDSAITMVETSSMVIMILTKVFLYVGIAMAIFSMLLFYNFISVSINNKKREIGILRAVGAKRIDVFKIFYSEAFIIAMVNFILSVVTVFLISWSVNKDLAKNAFFGFNLMSPDIRVVAALFGGAVLASFVSAFLPVMKIANKKPIDAIHNK